jgi:hypothetical protein
VWFCDSENLRGASSCFNFFPEFLRGRWLEPNIEFTFAPLSGRASVPARAPLLRVRRLALNGFPGWVIRGRGVVARRRV